MIVYSLVTRELIPRDQVHMVRESACLVRHFLPSVIRLSFVAFLLSVDGTEGSAVGRAAGGGDSSGICYPCGGQGRELFALRT